MITETPTISLSKAERSQLDRIREAKDLWREGRSEDALILIDAVKSETMTPRVAANLYVNEAVFHAEAGDMERSDESLTNAALFIDSGSVSDRGTFHNQRARERKERGRFSDALVDYAGAASLWQEVGDGEKQGAAALNVAGCYLALGDPESAQENLNKAFPLLKGSFFLPQAHDTQAKVHLAKGNLEHAAKSIATALSMECPDKWRADFLATRDQIETQLLSALQVKHFSDLKRVKLNMVRRALQASSGNPAGAAGLLGVTRFAIQSLIDKYSEELEPYRKEKRFRGKPIIKHK